MCLFQNSHSDRPRPGRRLGGLANIFSSRHRNSFSPNSGREELDEAGEHVGESSKKTTSTNLSTKPGSKPSTVENRETAVPEVSKSDTGSGVVKTANPRASSSQNRFSRNLSNNKTEAGSDTSNANREQDLLSGNEKSKPVTSNQASKVAISEQKKAGLLRRDKEKRLLVKQDSEDGGRIVSGNPQQDRLRSEASSDSEMMVHRSNRPKREEKKKPEGIKYLDAMSLR